MSITLVLWLLLFVGLVVAAAQRPAYGVAIYMLTFFLSPPLWWWGDPIAGFRWNLYSGFILLFAAAKYPAPTFTGDARKVLYLGMAIFINATLVHLFMAGASANSFEGYELLVKFMLLTYLIVRAVRSEEDLKIVLLAILIGAAYIGYECTFNERGRIVRNRLEGVGAPGASTANHFASLLVTILPLVAPFLLAERFAYKFYMAVLSPMIVNVVLLCNSRGGFLSAILSLIVFIFRAPAGLRLSAIKYGALGAVVVFMLMGDTRIFDRFMTTFSSAEERDTSAQSRLVHWKAGYEMAMDYPLGAGAYGFKREHADEYLSGDGARAIHNGFINEACEWGIQGLALRLLWFYYAIRVAISSIRLQIRSGIRNDFLLGTQLAVLAGLSAFLMSALFSDLVEAEWGYWMIALAVASSMLGQRMVAEHASEGEPVLVEG